ncbi:hypothetical protein V6N13_067811 [Hibiscus sabdariffa]
MEQSMADLAIDDDDNLGLQIEVPQAESRFSFDNCFGRCGIGGSYSKEGNGQFSGSTSVISQSSPGNSGHVYSGNQDTHLAIENGFCGPFIVADPSHSGTLSRYVDPAMGCEGDKSLPVMDEVMGSENEDSPLEHTDGLKRPQISSSPKTFSPIGDMGVVTREFSQTQSNMISTGLDIRASRKP